jgi:hypothetical protein
LFFISFVVPAYHIIAKRKRLGRPARTSSDITEMKEEQHGRVEKVREKMNEKVNTIKIDSIVIVLNRSWPFIFIGWGGFAPQGNHITSLIDQNFSIWLGIRGTGAPGM